MDEKTQISSLEISLQGTRLETWVGPFHCNLCTLCGCVDSLKSLISIWFLGGLVWMSLPPVSSIVSRTNRTTQRQAQIIGQTPSKFVLN